MGAALAKLRGNSVASDNVSQLSLVPLPPHMIPNIFMTIVDEKFERSMGSIMMQRVQQMSRQMMP